MRAEIHVDMDMVIQYLARCDTYEKAEVLRRLSILTSIGETNSIAEILKNQRDLHETRFFYTLATKDTMCVYL